MQPRILTLQPHQLIVAFLTQLQFPAVLAQQLLVVAINLLDGLANLGSRHIAIRDLILLASLHWPPGLMRYPYLLRLSTQHKLSQQTNLSQ